MPRFQVNIYQKISARASRSHYLLKGIRILFMKITKKCLKCPVFRSLYKKKSARRFALALFVSGDTSYPAHDNYKKVLKMPVFRSLYQKKFSSRFALA